jgi:hypothetical protein
MERGRSARKKTRGGRGRPRSHVFFRAGETPGSIPMPTFMRFLLDMFFENPLFKKFQMTLTPFCSVLFIRQPRYAQ